MRVYSLEMLARIWVCSLVSGSGPSFLCRKLVFLIAWYFFGCNIVGRIGVSYCQRLVVGL